MPSPSSSQQEARERLAKRLRALRDGAGLSNAQLSKACGWSIAKTSRIEHAKQPVSASDIRAWCAACSRPDDAADLVAAAQAAVELYAQWGRTSDSLREHQRRANAAYEGVRLMRVYAPDHVPGFLQTPAYMRGILAAVQRFGQAAFADDLDQVVAERMERRRHLTSGRMRFVFLLDEAVLYRRVDPDPQVMADQLDWLAAASRLPAVVLGVIPLATVYQAIWAREPFYLFDSAKVDIETISAMIQTYEPGDVRLYERAFAAYNELAVYGPPARELIGRARNALA